MQILELLKSNGVKEISKEELTDLLYYYFKDKNNANEINVSGMDFSKFDCNVNISHMKVKGNLNQGYQIIERELFQGTQTVGDSLFQSNQMVDGNLYQINQMVDGDLYQYDQKGDIEII